MTLLTGATVPTCNPVKQKEAGSIVAAPTCPRGISSVGLTITGRRSLLEALRNELHASDAVTEGNMVQAAVTGARKYCRVTVVRCYGPTSAESTESTTTADADADADADATAALKTKLTESAQRLYKHMQKILPAADAPDLTDAEVTTDIAQLLNGLTATAAGEKLPSFMVDADWKATKDCRVTLCSGSCDAARSHQDIGAGDETSTASDCPPGCGHSAVHGLCPACAPYQVKTLSVCYFCKAPFRIPTPDRSLVMVNVQKPGSAPAESAVDVAASVPGVPEAVSQTAQSSLGPTAHVRECYLHKTKKTDTNGRHVWTLTAEALAMSPSEKALLAAVLTPAPTVGDELVMINHIVVRQAMCGGCMTTSLNKPAVDDKSFASAAADDDDDVQYIHTRDDVIGLVAAQAAAKTPAEKRQLSAMFKDALASSLVGNTEKTMLTALHNDAAKMNSKRFQALLNTQADLVAALQAEHAAMARPEVQGQAEVRILVSLRVGGPVAGSSVKVHVEAGSGADASAKARRQVLAAKGVVGAADKAKASAFPAGPPFSTNGSGNGATSAACSARLGSLRQIAGAVNDGDSDSVPAPGQRKVVMFGRRQGKNFTKALWRTTLSGDFVDVMRNSFPGTSTDSTATMGASMYGDDRKFCVRAVASLESDPPGALLSDGPIWDQLTASGFNAFVSSDHIVTQYDGPGTAMREDPERPGQQQRDKLRRELIRAGNVTPDAVSNTAADVFLRSGGLVTWIDNALGNLASLYDLTLPPLLKPEPLPKSMSLSNTPVVAPADRSTVLSTGTETAISTMEVDIRENSSATEGSATEDTEMSGMSSTSPEVLPAVCSNNHQEDIGNDPSNPSEDAGSPPEDDRGEHEQQGVPHSAAATASRDSRGRSTEGRSTRSPSAAQGVNRQVVSELWGGEVEEDHFKNVRPGVSSNDSIRMSDADDANALIAVRRLTKGDLVLRENVGASADKSAIGAYEKEQCDNGRAFSTVSKGDYTAFLVNPGGGRTMTYLLNHSDTNANCLLTMPNRFRNADKCLIELHAISDIEPGTEFVWTYSSDPFPPFDATVFSSEVAAGAGAGPGVSGSAKRKSTRDPDAGTVDPTPKTFEDPSGRMRKRNVQPGTGNCFFSTVAEQLTLTGVQLPPKSTSRGWTHSLVRKTIQRWMMSTAKKDAVALSAAKAAYKATAPAIVHDHPEMARTTKKTRGNKAADDAPVPLSWPQLAKSIGTAKVWASPSIVAIVITVFKVDICYLTVVIGEDDDKHVYTDLTEWVTLTFDHSPPPDEHTSPDRKVLYMLYIDNRAKGWAHYDSLELVVAVLDKGNLPSAPPSSSTGPVVEQQDGPSVSAGMPISNAAAPPRQSKRSRTAVRDYN